MTEYLTTKDVAKLVRTELRTLFPGVKFSVRCGTGTGSSFIDCHWTDGPSVAQVNAVTRGYEGARDLTYQYGSAEEGKLPPAPAYHCRGITTVRRFSPAAHLAAQQIIATSSSIPEVVICDEDGALVRGELISPDREVQIDGRAWPYPFLGPHDAVAFTLRDRDLTPYPHTETNA
ncbi:LPD29 domain-containing protein [Clavibacter michiganensis]|uniref:LPD29 domain-containing protein n=1 Tax=Clavibacter michiganensis TaxID=28447 RepID=UPI00292F7005|nr:LPD29 domain-containing protein [Clavibacter michiganensis]